MKTFPQFIFECCSILFEGRYKQEGAFIRLFRQARGSKDWSKAAKLMDAGKTEEALELMQTVAANLRKRISDARNNPSSPLNYGRSDPKEFVKGKTDESEESFYDNLDAVADAVAHAPLEPKLRNAVTSKIFLGRQLFGTGTDIGKLTQLALDAGIKSQTSTADFRISSPRDSSKGSVGGSLKGGPAQIATAEPGDFRAAIQYAAQIYAANLIPETQRGYEEKRQEIINSLISSGNEIASFGDEQRIPKDRKSENEVKVSKAQSVLNSIYNNNPGFDGILSQTFASGSHRFQEPGAQSDIAGDVPGTASVMVHTPEPGQKGREFAIEPISQTEPVQGRTAQGRGASKPKKGERIQRPGTVRFDVNAPKEGEGTLSRLRSKVKAQQEAEAQQAAAEAQAELAQAEKAKERAERIIGPGGKRVLRQHVGAFLANNPDKAQQRSLKISAAQQNIDASTANINSIQQQKADAQAALTPEQPQPSTPEQVPPEQQQQQAPPPEQPQPSTPEQVPPEQQQQQAPPPEQVPPEQQQQQAPPPEEQQVQPEKKPKKKGKVEPENVEQTTEPVA
jgi:hypothetical protein